MIWFIIIVLSIASLLTVYSATGALAYKYQGGNTSHYMFKQLMSIGFGFGIIIAMSNISLRYYSRFSILFLYAAILLLAYTMAKGVSLNEASRWTKIPLIGISFQPSEIAKLAIIIFVARVLGKHQGDKAALSKSFWSIMIHTLIVVGLIFKDNLSTAVLIFGVVMIMMFIGNIPFKYLFGTAGVSIALLAIILLMAPRVDFLHRAETWTARVERFFSPEEAENKELNYQSDQAKIAIASGGLFGKGPGNSEQRNFLPHPYSDFIYAIIGEEYGFWGAFFILFAYIVLLGRVGVIVRRSSRTFPAFIALGLGFLLVAQAFINMGVSVGIFPVTGQPLPLVSMGTTSIFSTCVAFGAILCVSRQNDEEEKVKTPADGG